MKIRRGDNIMVLAGKDRGKSGLVERINPISARIVVSGIAKAKKHIKPSRRNPQGGIIDINLSIDISNTAIICPSCGKATRVGFKIAKGAKTRICRKCQQSLEIAKT